MEFPDFIAGVIVLDEVGSSLPRLGEAEIIVASDATRMLEVNFMLQGDV